MSAVELPRDDVTAIVLAGGRSARFGADKLAAALDGRPLLHHAFAAVGQVATELIVVVAPGGRPPIPADLEGRVRVVHDPEAFGGPLVGVAAALASVRTPTSIVVGGDMPTLVPAVLRRLVAALESGRPAVSLDVPGRIQPLPMALATATALAAATSILDRGGRSLQALLRELGGAVIPAPAWLALDPAAATIVDVDRPADLLS